MSDATWAVLAEDLEESELIELLMLIGHYMMLTTVLGSLRIAARAAGRGAWHGVCRAVRRPDGSACVAR